MALNCSDYGLDNFEFHLCTVGDIGGGKTGKLHAYALNVEGGNVSLTPQDWDGDVDAVFDLRNDGGITTYGGCTVDSFIITVSPSVGNSSTVLVTFDLNVSNCSDVNSYNGKDDIYEQCGDDPGPHRILVSETLVFDGTGCGVINAV